MAEIKNFGISGVGTNVQLGKAGPRLKVNAGTVEARNAADDSLAVIRAANAVTDNDVVTLAQLNTSVANAGVADGFHLKMGNVVTDGDGSWLPGAITITDDSKMSDVVDKMNTVLGLLTPPSPPAFPNANALTVSNTSGSTPVLSNGVTDNSGGGSGYTPGSAVTRVITTVNSNAFNDMGPGNSGTVQLLINGTLVGSKALTGTGDASTTNGLVIADQKDFPVATPGFWKSVDISVAAGADLTGINKFKLNHTGAGATSDVYFVRDTVTAVPAVTTVSLAQANAGTLAYSSSVPHYGTGASLTAGLSISNLAGQTYYGGADPLVISGTNSIFSAATYTYSNMGLTTPFAANTTTAQAISAVTITVNGTTHGSGTVSAIAKNVNGSSTSTALTAQVVLVKNGTAAAAKVDELSIPVSGLGSSPNALNAIRVNKGSGDTPNTAVTAWSNTNTLTSYDAAVVAGVLTCNNTDYSTGAFLPIGPNLSGRGTAQYATFSFKRTALSQFKIVVTGSYAGCWISLPNISDNAGVSPNALGGAWWNAFQPYDGAGLPGETGDTVAGCASGTVMNGASGTFSITFGTASSTSATGNEILVRFRLNTGQSITALSFTN
jgi:hypothetical protein